jgi:hypothetical protein
VLEFRKDKEAASDLRRIRGFFEENLSGKDPNYVADKLQTLQEDHERAARLWGFETATRAFSTVFESKSLISTGVAGALSVTAGMPLSAAAALSAIIPIGNFGLEVARSTIESLKAREKNPVGFLTRLKKLEAKK